MSSTPLSRLVTVRVTGSTNDDLRVALSGPDGRVDPAAARPRPPPSALPARGPAAGPRPPGGPAGAPPRGAPPGVYRIRTNGTDLVGNPPDPEQIEGMTVQKEFARAGAIVSVAANRDGADAWAGAHGYRHAMARAAAVIYSVHLRSAARGLTGTVFAGLSPSAVRRLLDSDGVSRHQMLAVTVAVPARAAPSSYPDTAPIAAPFRGAGGPARARPDPPMRPDKGLAPDQ